MPQDRVTKNNLLTPGTIFKGAFGLYKFSEEAIRFLGTEAPKNIDIILHNIELATKENVGADFPKALETVATHDVYRHVLGLYTFCGKFLTEGEAQSMLHNIVELNSIGTNSAIDAPAEMISGGSSYLDEFYKIGSYLYDSGYFS